MTNQTVSCRQWHQGQVVITQTWRQRQKKDANLLISYNNSFMTFWWINYHHKPLRVVKFLWLHCRRYADKNSESKRQELLDSTGEVQTSANELEYVNKSSRVRLNSGRIRQINIRFCIRLVIRCLDLVCTRLIIRDSCVNPGRPHLSNNDYSQEKNQGFNVKATLTCTVNLA